MLYLIGGKMTEEEFKKELELNDKLVKKEKMSLKEQYKDFAEFIAQSKIKVKKEQNDGTK